MKCTACDKDIPRTRYSFTVGWSRPVDRAAGRYGRQAWKIRFHNDPQCIAKIAERLDAWSYELGMSRAIQNDKISYDDDSYEEDHR